MYSNILIPLDLSHKEQAPELGKIATALAAGQSAVLNLLYVDQSLVHRAGYPHLDDDTYLNHRDEAMKELEELLSDMPKGIEIRMHCRNGNAHDQILETADEINADAIVMMAKKPGFSSYFIGSNAERVVRHAPCSVFIIRDQ